MRRASPEYPKKVLARAKLNLGLEVIGRRADGFHEIVTIYQSISLADQITISPAAAFSYRPISGIEPEDDLVILALELVRSKWQVELAADVVVEKGIPLAAGLGGSSADAAAILRTVAHLDGLPLSEVSTAGAKLGADVPFMIQGGTALGAGTGTTLTSIPAPVSCWFALVIPEVAIPGKTATLYRTLTLEQFSDGTATLAQSERLRHGEPVDAQLIMNPFEGPLSQYQAFTSARGALERISGLPAHVSGAGPALFTVCRDQTEAVAISAELIDRGYQSMSCQAVTAG